MRGGLKDSVSDNSEDIVCTFSVSKKGWENIVKVRDIVVKLGELSTFDNRKPTADLVPDGVSIQWTDPSRIIYGYVKLDPYKMTISGMTKYRTKFYFCVDYTELNKHFEGE